MTSVRSLATKLGATSGALAKSTLLAAGILGATLLTGGEAKAQNFFSCTIGVDCPISNPGWIIGDKRLSWASLPVIDALTPRPELADKVIFQLDEGRWEVVLEFEPNSQFGGSVNNTDPDNNAIQNDRAPRLANGNVAEAAWTYTLDILAPDPHTTFRSASAGADVSAGPGGYFDVVKDVVWNGSVTRFDLNEGAPNPQVDLIGGRSLTTTLDWGTCPNCSIASISDAYTQTTKVPGPLPVLGAAAAFGYSRRLRNRIRLHRPEARIEA